jgi:hypothetical protein
MPVEAVWKRMRECPEVSLEVVSESKGEIDEENSLASRPFEFSRYS